MSYDWMREEWAAARRVDEHAPHPRGCYCRACADAEAGPAEDAQQIKEA